MRFSIFLLLLGFLPLFSSAQEEKKTETEDPLEGHSHQGHAFNEGPRQASPLMGNTGLVHLPITTKWNQGQAYFDQGIGQLHGFWYYEAERSFRQILAHDPDCVMAYLGLTMANWENEKRAKEFLAKGAKLLEKATLSPLEKAYFTAHTKLFSEEPKDDKKRRENFLRDLENIILDFPTDLEAKTFYVCRRWQFSRKGIPIQSHVGLDAILEQIFSKSPHHPAHHFAIHLWDNRNHAQALDSAAKLGATAPAIAHMWHMPGHIYSKAKRFHDATWHQQASARIDHAHMQKHLLLPDEIHNYAHNNQWVAQNFTYLGDATAAIEMAKSLLANPRHPKLNTATKGGSSSKYGRSELIKILETFELWPQVIKLSKTQWFEELPAADDDRSRLRLMGLAHFHLSQKDDLNKTIARLDDLHKKALAQQKTDEDKAREKATKDKKNEKDLQKAVKDAGKSSKRSVDALAKILGELRGGLAELNGDKEAAKESLKHVPSEIAKMRRQLALGDLEAAKKSAEKHLSGDAKKTVPLAQAIATFYHCEKEDAAKVREAFEKLRSISSKIELSAPPFARLSPIAKKLGYPTDWRLAHVAAEDLLPRPDLDSLGPVHWTPPAAKPFSLSNQSGKLISLADYHGKPFILVFYLGAGCLHCTEQLTAMADRYSDFEKAKLPILAISTDSVTALKESQENYSKGDIPFPLISNEKKNVFKAYTAHDDFEDQPLHGTFVIDGSGRVLWTDISADPFMDLDFLIKEASRLLQLHR
ncbi:redoxin domain-containing protein [Akkermansiaceae bacterium]|nr:redoxin domain-containing protein [Akkermansiaceae bacterium]